MTAINFPSGAVAGTIYTANGNTWIYNGSSWTTQACLTPGGAGTGDMLMAVYDQNGNGIVDNSERLGGQIPAYFLK